MEQIDMFSLLYEKPTFNKPIKLIELFAGYGSQALALEYLGANFKSHKICEWAVKSIQAYKDIHFNNDNTDYSKDLSKDEIVDYLFNKGISSNYNEPMNRKSISRLSEKEIRTIYNNIKATHNLVNVQQVHYKDLEIDNESTFIMTYSFPCQDLSLAGKRAGMEKGSGTRSGLLWEVERILKERERDEAPIQVLLMENVLQVLTDITSWNAWCKSLEEMGYINYFKNINAKNYGIPQNRKRTFMVSIYGGESYFEFPKKMKLKYLLKDLLEKNVDEKYYLSQKLISCFMAEGTEKYNRADKFQQAMKLTNEKNIAGAITTASGNRATDNFIDDNYNKRLKETLQQNGISDGSYIDTYNKAVHNDISGTITTRTNKSNNTFIASESDSNRIKNATKKGYLLAYEGDGIDLENGTRKGRRGTVQNGLSQTLKTQDNIGVVVNNYIGTYNYSQSDEFIGNGNRLKENNDISETIDKPAVKQNLRIRKLTPKECFRLMGVKQEDFENVSKNQSDASLYHLAGDSIVTTCLMGIFGSLLGIDYKSKIDEIIEKLKG